MAQQDTVEETEEAKGTEKRTNEGTEELTMMLERTISRQKVWTIVREVQYGKRFHRRVQDSSKAFPKKYKKYLELHDSAETINLKLHDSAEDEQRLLFGRLENK